MTDINLSTPKFYISSKIVKESKDELSSFINKLSSISSSNIKLNSLNDFADELNNVKLMVNKELDELIERIDKTTKILEIIDKENAN